MDDFEEPGDLYLGEEFSDPAFLREVYEEAAVIFLERRAAASAALLTPGRASTGSAALAPPSRSGQEVKIYGPSRTFLLGLCLLLVGVVSAGLFLGNALSSGRSSPVGKSSSPASQSGSFSPPGDYTVTAQNELSPAQIDRLLVLNHSPAQGDGQVIYDLGVKYGIDDIYFPAWFLKETSMGKSGVASVFNPTGMECSDLAPACSGADSNGRNWAVFFNWPQGFEAWFKEISQRYVTGLIDNGYRLTTVELIACGPDGTGMYDGGPGCHDYAAWIEHTVDQWRSNGV
jgi:hypothetical protein